MITGCASPAYYTQAASGHLELMRQREDIETLLASGDTDPQLATRLELALDARRFAVQELGLPDTDSYRTYAATGRKAATWTVVAAPEFSVEPRNWCHLVAGCAPYRGYFKREDAERFAAKLVRKDFDVVISPAVAYSTLGWFDDPLLDTMLAYSDEQLAAILFHEMAHQALYVRGDSAFNEAFASFIEEQGLELWLAARGEQQRLAPWRQQRDQTRKLGVLLSAARDDLAAIYQQDLQAEEMRQAKQARLAQLRTDYLENITAPESRQAAYSEWLDRNLNNAGLALAGTYQSGLCAFQNLYRETGSQLTLFMEQARSRAELDREQRRAWLQQPCAVIAPAGNL